MNTLRTIISGLVLAVALASPVSVSADTPDTFTALFSGQQTVDGQNSVAVTFSEALDTRQHLDTYLTIFRDGEVPVEGAWVLSEDPAVAYFANVAADTRYVVKIYKGLTSGTGKPLAGEQTFEVRTRSAEPMIGFDSKGFVLASRLTRGLPVITLNIDRAAIDFFRIKPDRLAEFRQAFSDENRVYYYQSRDLNQMADLVYSGQWDLEINQNLRTQVNIPITHIEALQQPGVYYAVLQGAGRYDYGYSATWFTISDLGIHARKYPAGLSFFLQSLETAEPVENVRITGFDPDGKTLFETRTDAGGTARVAGAFRNLSLVTAVKGDHTSLLPMTMPALDLSEFRTAVEPFRPVDLFVYGPRDIYRPGETVILDGLLRNGDGGMTAAYPIKAAVFQPDGRMVHEFRWKSGAWNYYTAAYHLPKDAITGTWQVKFTNAGAPLEPYSFLVAEFLPERMKFEMSNPEGQTDILEKKQDVRIQLQGDFLYGAPAAGSRADAVVHVKPARELFKDQWPGYEFGDVRNLFTHSFTTEKVSLDENGQGRLLVKNQWGQVSSPHWVTANASLYDSGGRPVVRNRSWQVWPSDRLVGIRSLARDGQVDSDSTAAFEVMVADRQGNRLAADGLEAVVIREHREYYWEFRNGSWEWGSTSQFYPVDRFKIDIPENGIASVSVPVQWGGYRLEIRHPGTGLTSAYEIWAGWQPRGTAGADLNRPDRVDISLDKAAYAAGDQARVTLKSPEGGTGYLFVESDTNLVTRAITLPAEGKTITMDIDPAWQRHDIYLSAVIVRPGESGSGSLPGILPKRAVGLVHLPLERGGRRLDVSVDMPGKMEPGRRVTVPVRVGRADGSIPENARVTLAAVDVGILNLTRFETPSPFDYFFQARRYGVDLHDLYQKLIETGEGAWARQRFGGDAPSLSRGGDRPATDVQIVSLHRSATPVDETGSAVFHLDVPEFNGRVRLMAVAHTEDRFGSGEHELTIASPVVVQATMPRFLAMGDQGRIMLDVHNLSGIAQDMDIRVTAGLPVRITGESSFSLSLAPDEKRSVPVAVQAEQPLGRSDITCSVSGLVIDGKERTLERAWFLETRPAYPAETHLFRMRLMPGEQFDIPPETAAPLIRETVGILASLGSSPPLNLSDHISRLAAYPYGCLEQTVSGLFPHVILSGSDMAELGVSTGNGPVAATGDKIRLGIQRLMEKQKANGGFGLWSGRDRESAWLTAYAVHFLINAGQAGYGVPETALTKARERLLVYVRQPSAIPHDPYVRSKSYRAAVRAYAAFVLAMNQTLTLGDARTVYRAVSGQLKGALAFVHAGLALRLTGDHPLAAKALKRAIQTRRPKKGWIGDYGSDLRDFAAAYYLLAAHYPDFTDRSLFLMELDPLLQSRRWLSTQERNALVMAGSVRFKMVQTPWKARVTANETDTDLDSDRQKQLAYHRGDAADLFRIVNAGDTDLFIDVTLSGYPGQTPEPVSDGTRISRRFLDLNGKPVSPSPAAPGDRLLVELSFQADKDMPHCLLADLLPAGLELEDPNLSGSTVISDIVVDKKKVAEWHDAQTTRHTEYRDDRFVAALDIRGKRHYRRFYAVRVVSPGRFHVPPPLIEDMYRPWIRGIGETPDPIQVNTQVNDR